MLLSVIIVNYNTFEITCDCIRSIKQTAHVEYEIILIDNNSQECNPLKFLEIFPGINLIPLNENIGFGRANNLGVQKAKGKYVLLLNSDTIVHPNTINDTVSYIETNAQIDVVGCKVIRKNETIQKTVLKPERENRLFSSLYYFIKRNTLFIETRLFIYEWKQKKLSKKKELNAKRKEKISVEQEAQPKVNYFEGQRIGSLLGVFILLKRSVYLESKGFDPDFFMYHEEIEWFVSRLHLYNIVYYTNASVTHLQGASDVYQKMKLQFFVSLLLFWYKMGYAQYFFFLIYSLIEIPSRLLVWFFYNKREPSTEIPIMMRSFLYYFKILRYSNKYGSRKEMLKLQSLQKQGL